jgi:hypothetical protein
MIEKCTLYIYRVNNKPTYTLRLRQATVQAFARAGETKIPLVAQVKNRKGIPVLLLTRGDSLELNDALVIM